MLLQDMGRGVVLILCLFCVAEHVFGQEADHHSEIISYLGMQSEEDADETFVEYLEDLLSRPLKINVCTESSLIESGLFTRYQIASFLDYRSRNGDVLSFTELASLDGFGDDFVRRCRSFLSLESHTFPGARPYVRKYGNQLTLKSGYKVQTGQSASYGLKYKVESSGRFSAGLGLSGSYDYGGPVSYSGFVAWYPARVRGKVIAGDFNARFGQGLGLWTGMNLSGAGAPSSLMKRPSGLSPSSSFTGSSALRGIASEISLRRLRASALIAVSQNDFSDPLAAFNLSWNGRHMQAGITLAEARTSLDVSACLRGVDMFAEAVYDWSSRAIASLAGAVFPVSDQVRMAALLRLYPSSFDGSMSGAVRSLSKCSNEYAASLSSEYRAGDSRKLEGMISIDCAYFPVPKAEGESAQLYLRSENRIILSDQWKVKFRFNERIRSWGLRYRTDLRMDLAYESGRLSACMRVNALACRDMGFLTYAEAGYGWNKAQVYLRQGFFHIDSWDDRIYVYERDAPGGYNVPAFYGRGLWTSAVASIRISRGVRIYLRASMTAYPFMEKKKPGKAELKFQLKSDF